MVGCQSLESLRNTKKIYLLTLWQLDVPEGKSRFCIKGKKVFQNKVRQELKLSDKWNMNEQDLKFKEDSKIINFNSNDCPFINQFTHLPHFAYLKTL